MDGSQRSEEFHFSLLFFFIFSVVSVLERFTNVSYIFPLKHDTVIIYFVFLFYLLFYNRSLFYYQLFFQ